MNFDFKHDLTPEGRRFMEQVNKLTQLEIHVGYQAGEKTYEDGTDLAAVAIYNELGASDRPARPFLKQSIDNHEDDLKKISQQMLNLIANGQSAELALKRAGALMVGIVQEEIVDGGFAANAPSTIKKKGSAQPLIDSGLMRQSVHYVIMPRGSSR